MKNKQKAWRRDAQKLNTKLGSKHNGKGIRHTYFNMKPTPHPLLNWLLNQAK